MGNVSTFIWQPIKHTKLEGRGRREEEGGGGRRREEEGGGGRRREEEGGGGKTKQGTHTKCTVGCWSDIALFCALRCSRKYTSDSVLYQHTITCSRVQSCNSRGRNRIPSIVLQTASHTRLISNLTDNERQNDRNLTKGRPSYQGRTPFDDNWAVTLQMFSKYVRHLYWSTVNFR